MSSTTDTPSSRLPGDAMLASGVLVLVLVVSSVSLVGILWPSIWSGETALWAAQGIAQDWFDLLVLTPSLAVLAWGVARGRRAAYVLLAGALAFSCYSFAIYCFAVHFNALFIGYCTALGLSTALLVATTSHLVAHAPGWYAPRTTVKPAALLLMITAVAFASLWLSDILRAIVLGEAPASVVDIGVPTNPVHVLDLAFVLPAMFISGGALFLRRPLGFALAPSLLAFNTVMAASLGFLFFVLERRGLPSDPVVQTGLFGLAAALSVLALVQLARGDARRASRATPSPRRA